MDEHFDQLYSQIMSRTKLFEINIGEHVNGSIADMGKTTRTGKLMLLSSTLIGVLLKLSISYQLTSSISPIQRKDCLARKKSQSCFVSSLKDNACILMLSGQTVHPCSFRLFLRLNKSTHNDLSRFCARTPTLDATIIHALFPATDNKSFTPCMAGW